MRILRKIIDLLGLRGVARWFLNIVSPIFLKLFPLHWLWKREEASNSVFSKEAVKQGLERYEYSLYSQNGEDGILKYLFSQIGVSSKLFLEFGFGVVENNSLRLILKEGWGVSDGRGGGFRGIFQ